MPAGIRLTNFGGIMPRLHPTLLPAAGATRAHNCHLKDGKLSPLKEPAQLAGIPVQLENGLARIGGAGTIYLWHYGCGGALPGDATLLAWPGDVCVAESNLSQDHLSRLFVTGETGVGNNHPCMYAHDGNEVIRHDLMKQKMPPPEIDAEPPEDEANERYTVFYQSWIDKFGYESPPSRPSEEVTYNDGQTIGVQPTPAPAGAVKRRIWKVVSGTQFESIQFVAEQDVIEGADFFTYFRFALKDEDAGEILAISAGVPNDLVWVTRVPGDFYVGYCRGNKREVRFSEAGYPSFWPEDYGYGVGHDIVGFGVTLNSVFVLTRGMPYVISGTAPDTMNRSVLASPQGCVSAKSICVVEGAVFYASDDGVCMLQDGSPNVSVITDKMFTRPQWQKLGPRGCRMLANNSTLFVWFDGQAEGYAISLKDDTAAAITTHDEVARACCSDPVTDQLYFVRAGGVA